MKARLTFDRIVDSKDIWENDEPTFDQFETFLIDDFFDNPDNYFLTIEQIEE